MQDSFVKYYILLVKIKYFNVLTLSCLWLASLSAEGKCIYLGTRAHYLTWGPYNIP